MFTGIIEDIGTIEALNASDLAIATKLDAIHIGDSIAVNGICLTVTRISQRQNSFLLHFDFSPETWKRTDLKDLQPRSKVNLERALKAGDRVGGHFLTGHVDSVSQVLKTERTKDSYLVTIALPPAMKPYVVPKGSIGVAGISLTVAGCDERSLSVAVIPHTWENTTLKLKKAGDLVNLEPDMLAKYVEHTVRSQNKGITAEFLKENGFM